MRNFFFLILLTAAFGIAIAPAQEKVAEGQYQMQAVAASGAPLTKPATRWTLYGKPSGGYRLESEIENQPAGIRVVQGEELTDNLTPTAIGYELYRGNQPGPTITANCDFSGGAVVCSGNSGKDRADISRPYKPGEPFWMWIEGLSSLDIAWLFGGAVNMAHLDKGKTEIAALIVSGGSGVMIGDAVNVAALEAIKKPLTVIAPDKPTPWGFRSAEELSFEFVASETMELNGTQVAVKHYASTDKKKPGSFWTTDAGLIVKLTLNGPSVVLVDYKQYKKLIPELQVEKTSSKVMENVPVLSSPH